MLKKNKLKNARSKGNLRVKIFWDNNLLAKIKSYPNMANTVQMDQTAILSIFGIYENEKLSLSYIDPKLEMKSQNFISTCIFLQQ